MGAAGHDVRILTFESAEATAPLADLDPRCRAGPLGSAPPASRHPRCDPPIVSVVSVDCGPGDPEWCTPRSSSHSWIGPTSSRSCPASGIRAPVISRGTQRPARRTAGSRLGDARRLMYRRAARVWCSPIRGGLFRRRLRVAWWSCRTPVVRPFGTASPAATAVERDRGRDRRDGPAGPRRRASTVCWRPSPGSATSRPGRRSRHPWGGSGTCDAHPAMRGALGLTTRWRCPA